MKMFHKKIRRMSIYLTKTLTNWSFIIVCCNTVALLSLHVNTLEESTWKKDVFQRPIEKVNICLKVYTKTSIHAVSDKFLSVALDTSILSLPKAWMKFNTSSILLQTLAKSLSPAYLRFGGTSADYLFFNETMDDTSLIKNLNVYHEDWYKTPIISNITLTEMDWKKLNMFTRKVGWKLIFDLNALTRDIYDEWDPRNSLKLLRFNEKMGFSVDWELGNELNAHHQLRGNQLGKDFLKLRQILNSFIITNSSLLVGPDVTQPSHRSSRQFLKVFLEKASSVVDAVTFHQYYCNGRSATLKDFLNIDLMDSLGEEISTVKEIVNKVGQNKSIWLGESGSAWGGGAPGLSDSYIAGFLWLDKLGLSAARGLDVVIRQSFYHGHYSMITSDLYPLPDFWLSVLYKWLVGGRVLKVDVMQKDQKLRAYAHCTKLGRIYKTPGAVTLLVINVYNVTARLSLKLDIRMVSPIDAYLLTSFGSHGLQSKNVALNGKLLEMVREDKLPDFIPKRLPPNSTVEIPPLCYGFYVLPLLKSTACIN